MQTKDWRCMALELKKIRLEKLWTQEQLSGISGVSVRTIQRLENGEKASLETLRALAAALDMDPDSFSPFEESETPAVPGQPSTERSSTMSRPTQKNRYGIPEHLLNEWIVYAVVILMLMAINLFISVQHLWFIYPLLGWGVPLVIRTLNHRSHHPKNDTEIANS